MKLSAIIFVLFAVASCNANKWWLDKGKRKGWLDTITTVKYDTIRLNGSQKDSAFIFSSDTIWLRDKLFTTYYFRDTITQKDTVVKVEEKKVVVQEVKSELPWWILLIIGFLSLAVVVALLKR
jgi:hypothetical protein